MFPVEIVVSLVAFALAAGIAVVVKLTDRPAEKTTQQPRSVGTENTVQPAASLDRDLRLKHSVSTSRNWRALEAIASRNQRAVVLYQAIQGSQPFLGGASPPQPGAEWPARDTRH